MREFIYRIWDKEAKKYVMEGSLYGCEGTAGLSCYFNRNTHVVEEYTGLHDSKGNKIFEGDILYFVARYIYTEPAEVIGNRHQLPCKPDHNGECIHCDCWLSDCPLLKKST